MTTTPSTLDHTANIATYDDINVSARALRTLLSAAVMAIESTAGTPPMLGVHLRTREHPTTGATTLTGTATDGVLAVQANASAWGWWDATVIDAPHAYQLLNLLTDYLAIEDPAVNDDVVRLVRRGRMVTLLPPVIYHVTLPISDHEFPTQSLWDVIDREPDGWHTTATEALPIRLRQLVELDDRWASHFEVIKPNDGPVTHLRVGETIRAWCIPSIVGPTSEGDE